MRSDWADLPAETRGAIEAHTGLINRVQPAPTGNHANIASTVKAAEGWLFVKAASKVSPDDDGPEVRSLRWEAAINPHVTAYAPGLSGQWMPEDGSPSDSNTSRVGMPTTRPAPRTWTCSRR